MILAQIEALKEYILQHNTYFDKGYTDVYKDERTGIIHGKSVVFPTDKRGNIFYLRMGDSMRFEQTRENAMNDCEVGLAMSQEITLIAYVTDASADQLVKNLLWTVSAFRGAALTINNSVLSSAQVLINELSDTKETVLDKALQTLDARTALVSLTFTVKAQLINQSLSCITNPCNC